MESISSWVMSLERGRGERLGEDVPRERGDTLRLSSAISGIEMDRLLSEDLTESLPSLPMFSFPRWPSELEFRFGFFRIVL